MAADVGGLIGDIGLDVGGLRQDIKQANRELGRGTNKMNRHLGSLRKRVDRVTRGFKGLIGVISVALFARHIKQTIDAADQMLKMTQRIGGTTEALSELEFVAERSGVAFTTLTMGLQRMVRRVAEAAAGYGEAKGALEELRLDAQKLKALSIDQQFEVIADALFGVKNESDRVRLAMKLFDSEGVALLQTMTKGAEGIRELREEARKLGVTLSQDQAEAAMRAKDALTNLDAQVSSLTRNMTLGLIPAIEAVVIGWNSLIFNASPFPFQQQIDNARERLKALQDELKTFRTQGPGDPGFGLGIGLGLGLSTAEREKIAGQILDEQNLIDELIRKQKQELGLTPQPKAKEAGAEDGRAYVEGFRSELDLGGPLTADRLIPELTTDQVFPVSDIVEPAFQELEFIGGKAADNIEDDYNALATSIGGSLHRSFSDAFLGIETGFGDILRRMAADFLASGLLKAISSLGSSIPGPIGSFFAALPGLQHGGSFTVGGSGGPDSKLVAFRATPGEQVTVSPTGHAPGGPVIHIEQHIQAGLPPQWQAQLASATNIAAVSAKEAVGRELVGRR